VFGGLRIGGSIVSFFNQFMVIALLIVLSAFFSISEISLAASRKIKLRVMAQQGDGAAGKVLALQENPGHFFTVVQIGLNAIAILGGIVGESALSPALSQLIGVVYEGPWLESVSFVLSFVVVTSLFVLFADLIPKRLGMIAPERVAVVVVKPIQFFLTVFAPLVWVFDGLANRLIGLFKLPAVRPEDITSDEIVAMAFAGAQTGALLKQEHQLIANVFELDTRTVGSAMTNRESIVFFTLNESEESIRKKLAEQPHGKFPVCESTIDSVVGYVDLKDIFARILSGQKLSLRADPVVRNVLVIPDTLTLFEALDRFRAAREDFAMIVNEYALIVGVLSLQDVMNTVMGELGSTLQEELIVRRDEDSWLIDGITPIEDVMHALAIDAFDGSENYETIAGFMMYMLRKVPKRTDSVIYRDYKFEVVDIDHYRIDQLLVTRATKAGT
jgi:CBS domain containing-hemolysin-like protein